MLRLLKQALLTAAALALPAIPDAHALQYQRVPVDGSKVIILARGPIVTGDWARFFAFVGDMPPTDRIVGIALDSPGGNVFEAERLAEMIHKTDTSVLVNSGSTCASACFLLFAAAPRKFAFPDALIGVHSVSESGKDTFSAMAYTTALARDAAGYGVPEAIVGKIVQTPPGRMAWLTPDDLAALQVTVIEEPTTQPTRLPAPSVATNATQSATSQYAASPAFRNGLNDRRAWEQWFAGLSGDYRAGALYWSAQRSLPQPGQCFGPAGQNLGPWTAGCVEAQQRLAAPDALRRSEPDYRLGWNSF